MTVKELAALLSGREYMSEITTDEMSQAKSAGLVVVFGYSDDNTEFRGAINDEVGSYDGTTIYLTKAGILKGPDCSCAEDCPYKDPTWGREPHPGNSGQSQSDHRRLDCCKGPLD